ncbi:MAG: ATP-binding cassette domain-containing protein [Spirochaetes bacterium]|uniref:ATP-binding cassette domain-containing protein n=1 Tax=Candidatus Avitreponema avistercoris TaxID=2840705 RepID=A0A9D9EN21_9SPIR|nr:ATP-binding cassette domain-containing protein [Candidatus Avitreponema avistercoris]
MIEASHLCRDFGDFRAVDDVSFSIQTGEIVGLLGPNGAGKTTTMRMVTGFLTPSSGTVCVDGLDITADGCAAKNKIGYMPESAPLYGDMITEDYLAYVARMYGKDPEERLPRFARLCGIGAVMDKNISDLSRGYRQRVGLAHALMNDPEILILDEPTGGLDPNQIGDVRALIKEIGKTRTVILSTHILSEVEMLCDRVIIIAGGKIKADSPTEELRSRFGHNVTLRLSAAGCQPDGLCALLAPMDGVLSVVPETPAENSPDAGAAATVVIRVAEGREVRPEIFRRLAAKNWPVFELSVMRDSLEDIFRTLTTGGNGDA